MRLTARLIAASCLISVIGSAQQSFSSHLKEVSPDCKTAIDLGSEKEISYGPTEAPKGYGSDIDVFACDEKATFCFEAEHNSAWYKFTVPMNGWLVFEIDPVNSANDYDFMLFKWDGDTCFCENISREISKPVRVNLARSGTNTTDLTGLSSLADQDLVPAGVGNSFSSSLQVRKDEVYYLVLDNVYPKGDGHMLFISFLHGVTIGGETTENSGSPLPVKVQLQDRLGYLIASSNSNNDGKYEFLARIKDDQFYSLIYSQQGYFPECYQVYFKDFLGPGLSKTDFKTSLRKLEHGKKYVVSSLLFDKNNKIKPASYPSLNAVAEALIQNPDLKIQIEGHVNNPKNPNNSGADNKRGMVRAEAVFNYLKRRGVSQDRMTTISYGSLYMLHQKPNSARQINENNRIEIFILPTIK